MREVVDVAEHDDRPETEGEVTQRFDDLHALGVTLRCDPRIPFRSEVDALGRPRRRFAAQFATIR